MLFLQASAKTKVGIQQVFDELVSKIVENPALAASADATATQGLTGLGATTTEESRGGVCC